MLKTLVLVVALCSVVVSSMAQKVIYSEIDDRLMAIEARNGQQTPFLFTEISSFKEGIAWVNNDSLYGFIDTSLVMITDFVYTQVSGFQHGFAVVSRDSTFGFINKDGIEICELKYQQVRNFHLGMAPVQSNELWGMIDSFGKEIIKCVYHQPTFAIKPDFVLVSKDDKWGVVDGLGQILYPLQYDLITVDGIGYEAGKKVVLSRK